MTLMEGWQPRTLIELADYINGFAFKPDDWGKDGLPIIRIEQLKNPDAPTDYYTGRLPARQIIDNGDLIFSWSASLFLRIWRHGRAALNQHLFRVVERESVDRSFLKAFIEFYLPELTRASHGSTMQHITRKELVRFSAQFPVSKYEQSKIAKILTTVDLGIEQMEALIAKQQRIKTGLIQDLLTRGIDEYGNLRSEQTHEFKDSPLGRIPVEWHERTLSNVLVERPRNGIYKPASQIGSGTLLVGQTSFTSERRVDFRLARRAIITSTELRAYRLLDDDILITRVFATVEGVGRPVLVRGCSEEAVFESNMLRLRIDARQIEPYLLFCWLDAFPIRNRITSAVNASNQTSVNQTVLNGLPVLVPPPAEQQQLVEVLSAQEAHLLQQKTQCEKLKRLKTGLMHDLLTGNRRVTDLLAKPESAGL